MYIYIQEEHIHKIKRPAVRRRSDDGRTFVRLAVRRAPLVEFECVRFAVYTSVCIYICVCMRVCMFPVHVVIEFERTGGRCDSLLPPPHNFLFLYFVDF